MDKNSYIKSSGIYYPAILVPENRSKNPLQPLYEAITNSFEAISQKSEQKINEYIKIELYYTKGLFDNKIFNNMVIEDSGIGFNQENFERINRYKDTRKGFNNRGSGRIQLLQFFNTCEYDSVFQEKQEYKNIRFIMSTKFLDNDSIILFLGEEDSVEQRTYTRLTVKEEIPEIKEYFNDLNIDFLKQQIISHYILYFCSHRETLPAISLTFYIDDAISEKRNVVANDIPKIDKQEPIKIYYQNYNPEINEFNICEKFEEFFIRSFMIPKEKLDKNEILLTSKEEIVYNIDIKLNCLAQKDVIENHRFLFLLSSEYLDKKDHDIRGNIKLIKKEDFKRESGLFLEEEIFIDEIEGGVNNIIVEKYHIIKEKMNDYNREVDKLKEMFLLNVDIISDIKFSINDSEEEVLKKVYISEGKTIAKKDAIIKKSIESLDELDPSSTEYEKEFNEIVSDLVRAIPLQNRTALSHYIARRKLVLDLFGKIIEKQLKIQKQGSRDINEKLLHNLIFQETSDNPENSDLWLINEDFIYFQGISNIQFCDVEIQGKKLFKSEFSEKEKEYLDSLGEKRLLRKPDILLFPNEGKCIIIELKNIGENISKHLHQINQYAFLIKNYANESFHIESFYGYLIGESIENLDVRSADADFLEAYKFDYLYRPNKPVLGLNGRDGSLYTEVVKYSTLLERAKARNEIFIRKLMNNP
ncbi:MAG: hypothetical protein A2Y33_12540 [Spirochaetes bacterium GWF1_51_8]|nr:MAG: hypothetical protein A2Y33_12540 [Spirochaetes bacterium GWF1_51_8]